MRCHGDGHIRLVLLFPAACEKKRLPHSNSKMCVLGERSCNKEERI